jgi:hypothetical protein
LNLGQGHQQKGACSLISEILNAVYKVMVGGIFCSLEKAFDCANHNILLYILKFYGITSKAHALIESSHRLISRVIINVNYNASLSGVK